MSRPLRAALYPFRRRAVPRHPMSAYAAESETTAALSRRIRVYTRTGDKGSSSLYNGERRPKDDAHFAALGDVDELNASIGLARVHAAGACSSLDAQLVEVQSRLLDVGSAIATPISTSTPAQLARAAFPEHCTTDVERWIDEMDDTLPPLRNFILPGGSLAAAQLHVARTIARRAERRVVALGTDGAPHEVAVYLNRLSDYLFVAARFVAMRGGAIEAVYVKARGLTERPLTSSQNSFDASRA